LYSQVGRDIEQTKHDIEKLKVQLEQEKIGRKHLEEYDSLSKFICELPERKETYREIEEQNKQIQAVQEELNNTSSKLDLRSKQFQLLMYSIHELQRTLEEEEEKEKQKLLQNVDNSNFKMDDNEDSQSGTATPVNITTENISTETPEKKDKGKEPAIEDISMADTT